MDPELLELISRLNAAEGDGAPLSDDELADLRNRVAAILAEIPRTNPSDADLEVATEGASVIRAIDAEAAGRATSAAERAERLAAELDGLELPEVADETPAEEVPAETDEEPAPVEDAPAEVESVEQVPVAAAAAPPARVPLPRISHLASRTPKRNKPVPTATAAMTAPPTIVASGDMPGISAGREVTMEEWADGVAKKWHAVQNGSAGDGVQFLHLGKLRHAWPEEWKMTANEIDNERKMRRITDEAFGRPNAMAASGAVGASLTASGGICGPVAADYTVSTIASAARPVRDGMVQTGATRGGVRFILPHTLAAVHADAPASLWTQATDASPGNSTKGYATYVCQTPQEKYVDAVVSRVRFGNFQARYFPEQVDQYMATVEAEHARLAESTALATMVAGSTSIVAGNNGSNQTGAATEYLAEIDRIAAAYRYRHRMAEDSTLQLMYPEWFEDMMRADLARELPGNSGGQSERLAVADSDLARFFSVRNLLVTTFLDNPTSYTPVQGFVVQGVGDALPWPTKVLSFMFHPGAWQFLDGGELNLGMVRDSTLSNTNSFEMFSETFEQTVFRGHESLAITTDLCPDGARAATVDTTTLCSTGS